MTNVNSSNTNPLSAQDCNDSTEQKFAIPKVCLYQYSNLIECANESINFINKANDQLSSVSIVNTVAVVYEHGDYGGRRKRIDRNFPYIGDDFNDLVSSIKVSPKKTYFITSDPQIWCGVKNCGVDDAESERNIKQQYQYVVTQNPNAKALIMNGDLTDYGHAAEWADFERLLTSLTVDINDYMPYYYGLGNHDIYNNFNDCFYNNCTIRSFSKRYSHVNSKNNIPAFNVVHSWGYQFPEVQGSYIGSFSYHIDFVDVLFIQLNDYEEDKNL